MTTSYYVPPENVRGNVLLLPEEEAHHAARVLRARPGDEIVAVDGQGGWYRAEVDQADKRSVSARIVERRSGVGEPPYELTIGLAVLKNPGRFETFLEKAVELGVRRVVPLVTERTEKARIKESRASNILVAAMKQCGRSRLVALDDPRPLADFLGRCADGLRLICHEQTEPEHAIARQLEQRLSAATMSVLVGPEGGFSDAEIRQAAEAGFVPVSLGPRRLRAETAALAAAAAVMLLRP
ncbi:MAG TPA: RsmE family RNA methyltransferase [Rhodothermales bacterium]|nr:RsmE family RNA methyltransferase [Rhodothermales bacterium]